jgi:hypothetical protein
MLFGLMERRAQIHQNAIKSRVGDFILKKSILYQWTTKGYKQKIEDKSQSSQTFSARKTRDPFLVPFTE